MKKLLPDIIAILAFVVISFVYFFPADIEGRILFQHDSAAGAGAGRDAQEYFERTGERSRWTNSIFGGMPTYQMAPSYDSTKSLSWVEKTYQLYLPEYVVLTFIMMLGFYILLRAFGISAWLAGVGGIIWAFSSYFFILIPAGHIWKFVTLAYIPPTIAGIVLAYRRKYLLGGIITALFIALQIRSNHIQMSYYFMFVILFIIGAYFEEAYKKKELTHFFKASAILALAAMVGVCINLSNLYHTYEYSKETMRGKSELKQEGNAANQTSSGLDRDYITNWSYGIGETLTLLVPNVKGGASSDNLSQSETAMEKANPMYSSIYSQFPQYFGDQPWTAGPVYVGAFVMFLFVLGCFIVKGPLKWALLGATIFSVLLSWGKNFMGLTDFFIDYVPMYNKFRTVEMALVIPGMVFPIIAIWGLKEVLSETVSDALLKRGLIAALAITGGLSLILWLMPSMLLDFRSSFDAQYQLPDWYYNALLMDRASLASADALRSLVFILLGAALLFWFYTSKDRKKVATFVGIGVAVLMLVDLWTVDKRYLNDSNFIRQKPTEVYKETVADQEIMKDKDLSYRVLNLNNPFLETTTSYYHHSIGGYYAAKLRRYQELIDHRLQGELNSVIGAFQKAQTAEDLMGAFAACPSLNMLNTRYIIYNPEQPPLRNPFAFGNAWFVDKVEVVENADAEIAALNTINPLTTAVVDKRFADEVKGFTPQLDSTATITLDSYRPNKLVYTTKTNSEQLAVFSEIYYQPGWEVTIDGKPASHFRADWILRAMLVPAGEHQIVFEFRPQGYITAAYITSFSSLIILLLLIGAVGYSVWKARKQKEI